MPACCAYNVQTKSLQKDKGVVFAQVTQAVMVLTGGGITVGRFQQLFLLAMSKGKKQPAEWA